MRAQSGYTPPPPPLHATPIPDLIARKRSVPLCLSAKPARTALKNPRAGTCGETPTYFGGRTLGSDYPVAADVHAVPLVSECPRSCVVCRAADSNAFRNHVRNYFSAWNFRHLRPKCFFLRCRVNSQLSALPLITSFAFILLR